MTQLKSKLRNLYRKYNNITVQYKYQYIIASFTNYKTIKVLKQVKGRGVVIVYSSKHTEKCLEIPEVDHFEKINDDPTKRIESKIQICLRN